MIPVSPVETWLLQKTGLPAGSGPDALFAWQMQRAWQTLSRAKAHSAFYQAHLADCSMTNWQDVPTMNAQDLLPDPFALLCIPGRDVSRVIRRSSSGTVTQKQILFMPQDLEATIEFFAHGMSTMVSAGDRVAVCMRGHEPDTIADLLARGLAHIGARCTTVWPLDDLNAIIRQVQDAHCMVAMPAFALALAQHAPGLRPRAVLLSADYVPQPVIARIQRQWQCRVLTHYGLTETGYGAGVQCMAQQGYHMRDADYLFEILHPQTRQPVPDGQMGEVVLTSLQPRAMPLIRYRTGDTACRLSAPCPCGGTLARLGKVTGRMANQLSWNGGQISITLLDEQLFALPQIWDYAPRLDRAADTLILRIYAPQANQTVLEHMIRHALGQPERLRIEWADAPFAWDAQKRGIALI